VIAEWSVLYPGIIFVFFILKLEKDILNLEDIMNSAPSELIQSSLNNKKIEFERKREEKVFFKCYITFTQVFLFFCEFNIMIKKRLVITI
jgi:hypothetical protein